MSVDIDASKILTAVILALVMYIGQTVYELDVEMELVKYQLQEANRVLQDIYETKANK